jgi:solute carrier family 35 (UDP-galactose transporter), member B1
MNVSLVIALQAIIACSISSTIIQVFGMGSIVGSFHRSDLKVGMLNFATQFASNYSLKFVNYPFMVLAKSAKVLPVIFAGWARGIIKLRNDQFVIAVAISAGLIIFNSSKMSGLADESLFGVALVLTSLMFDGLASSEQDKNHRETKREFAYFSMFYNNACILLINIAIFAYQCIATGDDSLQRMIAEPSLLRDTLLISFAGAVGQIFIYLTISLFDGYKLSIATTSRKCVSVVISAQFFDHKFTPLQWTGASLVLGSTCAEVYFGGKAKQKAAAAVA